MDQPTISGYENFTRIGKGGFSKVFQATQKKFGRRVAVKVLDVDGRSESDRRAFEREAQLMGLVSTHPNIVTVYDTAFTRSGQPCIVMELCSGGTIADRLKDLGQFTPQEVVDVGMGIAGALETSHGNGVLHRDIKPQNILITDFGQPALSDFGISAFDDERPQTGEAAGFTLHYAAPEVIEGAPASPSSDIYSLAATLYTTAAGQRPFATPGVKLRPGELARRVLLETAQPLSDFGVPDELSDVIAKALSKDPADRPQTAAEFRQQLHQIAPAVQNLSAAAAPAAPISPAMPRPDQSPDTPREILADAPGTPGTDAEAEERPAENIFGATDEDDSADHTVLRPAAEGDRSAGETPDLDTAAAEDTAAVSPVRRRLAWAVPVAAIGIAALGFIVFGGGNSDPEDDPPPATATVALGVDPVRAPDIPSDVTIERLVPGELEVHWTSADTDVTFEVRRTDISADTIATDERTITLAGIAGNEQPCVAVVAIRGARHSNSSGAVCAALPTTWVEVLPGSCEISQCSVRLRLHGLPAGSRVDIAVMDPDGVDLNGFAPGAYETSGTLDDEGNIAEWRLTLGTQLQVGRYRIDVADDVGITAVGFLDVA